MTPSAAPVRTEVRQGERLRRWAASGAQHAPLWFARAAPPLIGVICAMVLGGSRRCVLENLRRIHGVRAPFIEAWDVVLTFIHFARNLAESLAPERLIGDHRDFRVRGRGKVQPYFDAGRGLVFVTAHIGPWDRAAMRLRSMLDVPVMMLMSAEEDERAQQIQDELRVAQDVTVLRLGNNALDALPVLQHLEAGGAVVAQIDRVPKGRPSISAPLFGKPFSVPRGLFQLAAIARCPLVPVFSARQAGDRRLVEVGEPIFIPRRPQSQELALGASQVLSQMQRHLAAFPTQWFHFVSDSGQIGGHAQ